MRLLASSVLILLVAPTLWANPINLLRRVLAEPFGANVQAIQTRTEFGFPTSFVIKLDMVKEQGAKIEVLEPSTAAGFLAIDDGKEFISREPGKDFLTVQLPRLFIDRTSTLE